LGQFSAGTELVFALTVNGQEFLSTDPAWARVEQVGDNEWVIGWEDRDPFSGDFNDLVTTVTAQLSTSYSVLQMNICNSGKAGCYTGMATAGAIDLINDRKPSVLTLNEACSSDWADIKARTGYDGVFTPSGSQTCTGGRGGYGNALLFPAGTSFSLILQIPYTCQYEPKKTMDEKEQECEEKGKEEKEKRTLTCAVAGGVTACVTHLDSKSPTVRAQQAQQMEDKVNDYAEQGPAVLGGDWNLKAKKAQEYVPAGMFRKGDGDVQHIMASHHFGFVRKEILDEPLRWTDHRALQVYLRMKVAPPPPVT
jgi:hypothetical protein